jgi:hypothetical protein
MFISPTISHDPIPFMIMKEYEGNRSQIKSNTGALKKFHSGKNEEFVPHIFSNWIIKQNQTK